MNLISERQNAISQTEIWPVYLDKTCSPYQKKNRCEPSKGPKWWEELCFTFSCIIALVPCCALALYGDPGIRWDCFYCTDPKRRTRSVESSVVHPWRSLVLSWVCLSCQGGCRQMVPLCCLNFHRQKDVLQFHSIFQFSLHVDFYCMWILLLIKIRGLLNRQPDSFQLNCACEYSKQNSAHLGSHAREFPHLKNIFRRAFGCSSEVWKRRKEKKRNLKYGYHLDCSARSTSEW